MRISNHGHVGLNDSRINHSPQFRREQKIEGEERGSRSLSSRYDGKPTVRHSPTIIN
jgi:hypothetical protein